MNFGIYQLEQGPFHQETRDKEYVLVPVTAEFKVECNSQVFEGSRVNGPFATLPAQSNALAIYIPRDSLFKISGRGEVAFFSAPASKSVNQIMSSPDRLARRAGVKLYGEGTLLLLSLRMKSVLIW